MSASEIFFHGLVVIGFVCAWAVCAGFVWLAAKMLTRSK